jgi:hypothetical protein
MRAGLLRRYVCEESSEAERRMVEAHLAHCRACRQTQARMRGYLAEVAGPLLVIASSAESGRDSVLGDAVTRLPQLIPDAANALGEVGRGVRERVREGLFRLAVGLPTSGGEPAAGPALNASVKIASACAGLAAGACIAAGVLPGVGGIGLAGQQGNAKRPPAEITPHLGSPATKSASSDIPGKYTDAPITRKGNSTPHKQALSASRRSAEPSTSSDPSAPSASNSASEARISGRQTGAEFGVESTGRPSTEGPTPAPSQPSGDSGGASPRGQGTSSEHHSGSASEFGM